MGSSPVAVTYNSFFLNYTKFLLCWYIALLYYLHKKGSSIQDQKGSTIKDQKVSSIIMDQKSSSIVPEKSSPIMDKKGSAFKDQNSSSIMDQKGSQMWIKNVPQSRNLYIKS